MKSESPLLSRSPPSLSPWPLHLTRPSFESTSPHAKCNLIDATPLLPHPHGAHTTGAASQVHHPKGRCGKEWRHSRLWSILWRGENKSNNRQPSCTHRVPHDPSHQYCRLRVQQWQDVILKNYSRPYSVRTLTYVDVFQLTKAKLQDIIQHDEYPATRVTPPCCDDCGL